MKRLTEGFSLLELLVALMIMALLLMLSISSFQYLQRNIQQHRYTQHIAQLVNYLRHQAMSRRQLVVLCQSDDGQRCARSSAKGWLAFVDRKDSRQPAQADDILYYLSSIPQAQITWRGFVSNRYLLIHPSGLGRAMAGSFYYQHRSQPQPQKIVTLNRVGRVVLHTEYVRFA